MKKRSISLFLMSSLIALCCNCVPAKAFQPVSHYILIESIGDSMPSDSIIAKSIKKYPSLAIWGANALDLGYLQPGQLLERAPWADRYHYYKVGTFAKEQLKEALSSKDMKKIAFAAGWVSHITGDLACHGEFVNPECGVYLANESSRPLHKKLENSAEIYVFSKIAHNPINNYNTNVISNKFSNIDDIPFTLVNDISNKVYGQSPNITEETLWCKTLHTGLKSNIGYTYSNSTETQKFLSENNREERLKKAFNQAKTHGIKLLTEAEKGDYSNFSDRWNLDVGVSKSPISSLTVSIKTGKKLCAGTDDDIYLVLELKNGKTKEWKLDKKNYNDFEFGDYDEYYLYINDVNINPTDIIKTYVSKKKGSKVASEWYLKNCQLNVNGKDTLKDNIDKWITDKDNKANLDVKWTSITNTIDPSIK